jgi:hypothetical protein
MSEIAKSKIDSNSDIPLEILEKVKKNPYSVAEVLVKDMNVKKDNQKRLDADIENALRNLIYELIKNAVEYGINLDINYDEIKKTIVFFNKLPMSKPAKDYSFLELRKLWTSFSEEKDTNFREGLRLILYLRHRCDVGENFFESKKTSDGYYQAIKRSSHFPKLSPDGEVKAIDLRVPVYKDPKRKNSKIIGYKVPNYDDDGNLVDFEDYEFCNGWKITLYAEDRFNDFIKDLYLYIPSFKFRNGFKITINGEEIDYENKIPRLANLSTTYSNGYFDYNIKLAEYDEDEKVVFLWQLNDEKTYQIIPNKIYDNKGVKGVFVFKSVKQFANHGRVEFHYSVNRKIESLIKQLLEDHKKEIELKRRLKNYSQYKSSMTNYLNHVFQVPIYKINEWFFSNEFNLNKKERLENITRFINTLRVIFRYRLGKIFSDDYSAEKFLKLGFSEYKKRVNKVDFSEYIDERDEKVENLLKANKNLKLFNLDDDYDSEYDSESYLSICNGESFRESINKLGINLERLFPYYGIGNVVSNAETESFNLVELGRAMRKKKFQKFSFVKNDDCRLEELIDLESKKEYIYLQTEYIEYFLKEELYEFVPYEDIEKQKVEEHSLNLPNSQIDLLKEFVVGGLKPKVVLESEAKELVQDLKEIDELPNYNKTDKSISEEEPNQQEKRISPKSNQDYIFVDDLDGESNETIPKTQFTEDYQQSESKEFGESKPNNQLGSSSDISNDISDISNDINHNIYSSPNMEQSNINSESPIRIASTSSEVQQRSTDIPTNQLNNDDNLVELANKEDEEEDLELPDDLADLIELAIENKDKEEFSLIEAKIYNTTKKIDVKGNDYYIAVINYSRGSQEGKIPYLIKGKRNYQKLIEGKIKPINTTFRKYRAFWVAINEMIKKININVEIYPIFYNEKSDIIAYYEDFYGIVGFNTYKWSRSKNKTSVAFHLITKVCHELAHITYIRHGKNHQQLTETYIDLALEKAVGSGKTIFELVKNEL